MPDLTAPDATPDTPRPPKPLNSVMGFDFGERVIGVAMGQTLTCTASPIARLPARDGIPDWNHIQRLIQEWQPDAFVVGIPLNMDGTETHIAPRARKFGNRLQGRFGKPWFAADERLSTREAWSTLEQHGRKALKGGQRVDDVAATLLLESWLRERSG